MSQSSLKQDPDKKELAICRFVKGLNFTEKDHHNKVLGKPLAAKLMHVVDEKEIATVFIIIFSDNRKYLLDVAMYFPRIKNVTPDMEIDLTFLDAGNYLMNLFVNNKDYEFKILLAKSKTDDHDFSVVDISIDCKVRM